MTEMPKHGLFKDLTDCRFGKFIVVSYAGKVRGLNAWNCECDCGNKRIIQSTQIKKRKSCGCFLGRVTHGHTRIGKYKRTYISWSNMKQRCLNPKRNSYKYYGGRGIKVCDRWLHSFENFLADMGECPPGLTIDRIENDGNYEKGNCRWATIITQITNRRKGGKFKLTEKDVITILSSTKRTMADYKRKANTYGVSFRTIQDIILRYTWKHI